MASAPPKKCWRLVGILLTPSCNLAVASPFADRSAPIPWIFSRRVDLLTFLGSALVAMSLLAIAAPLGLLHREIPSGTWIVAILLIDVAHVYATGFRVYFDRKELQSRPWLYGLTPFLAFAIGLAVYSESVDFFWRVLAYLAVFHFIRQQFGWVAIYRSRAGEHGRLGRWIDTSAIYLATVYPLVYWHSHLPRQFWWFRDGDFASLSADLSVYLAPVYLLSLVSYCVRSGYRGLAEGKWNPGKDVVVGTTTLCWYVGIVALNSDYAFTVTNVIIHGIPYMVLVYWHGWNRQSKDPSRPAIPQVAKFLSLVWLLAYAEELLWDCGVWHERSWLFGPSWDIGWLESMLVPLLAVPQITHYVLDGFIWRRRSNKRFSLMVQSTHPQAW